MPLVLIVPLALILTAFVAYGSAFLQHSSSQGFIGWLANAIGNVPILGGFTIKQVLKLDAWITHYVGSHFKQVEQAAVAWIAGMASYAKLAASGAFGWPAELWALTSWIVSTAIPRGVKSRTDPIARKAAHADATAAQAIRGVQGIARAKPGTNTQIRVTKVERVAMPHAAEWDWITNHWHSLTRAVTGTLPLPRAIPHPHAPALDWPFGITPTGLRRRLRRLEGLLGVAGLAAVMAQVFRIPNARCLSSGPIGRVARFLCGMDSWLLNLLLAGAVEAFVVADLCDFSDLLIRETQALRPSLMALVSVEDALVGCHDFTAPRALALPAVSLPALVDAVAI